MTTKREHRWPLWPWLVLTAAGVAITVTAGLVSSTVNPGEVDTPTTVTVTADPPAPSTVTASVTATVTASNTATAPRSPVARFDDGLFDVGVDVLPGTFHTGGPDGTNTSGCYWTRTTRSGDVVANGLLLKPGSVTMSDGELFDTAGCQPWQLET